MSECKIIEEFCSGDLEKTINRYLAKGYTLINCWSKNEFYYAALVR